MKNEFREEKQEVVVYCTITDRQCTTEMLDIYNVDHCSHCVIAELKRK